MKDILKSKTDWKKLHQQDDSNIDYSDIPETDEKFWEDAEIKNFTTLDLEDLSEPRA